MEYDLLSRAYVELSIGMEEGRGRDLVRVCADLDTAGCAEGFLDVAVDGELTSSL